MRSAATLFVAYLLLILQSTVLEMAPVHMAVPSFGLLVVLHVGLSPSKWTISSAAIVAFATGYLFDLVSGAPQGVHAFVFTLMTLFARALTRRVAVNGIVLGAATSVASLLATFLVVLVRAQVAPEGGYGGLRQAPLEALLTAIFGPLVLSLFRRLDGRVDTARSRVGLARGPRGGGTSMSMSLTDRR